MVIISWYLSVHFFPNCNSSKDISKNAMVLPWYLSMVLFDFCKCKSYPSLTQILNNLQSLQNTAQSAISLSLSLIAGRGLQPRFLGLPHSHQWWLTTVLFFPPFCSQIQLYVSACWYRHTATMTTHLFKKTLQGHKC